MIKITIVPILFMLLAISGCLTSGKQVPLEDLVVASKHGLVIAQERIIFEEFVKAKVFTNEAYSLYKIESVKITAGNKDVNSSEASLGLTGEYDFPTGSIGVTGGKKVTVSREAAGNLEITLKPLGQDLKVINDKIFADKNLGEIYAKIVPNENKMEEKEKMDYEKDFNSKCNAEKYCFGLKDADGKFAYYYLLNIKNFRNLLFKVYTEIPSMFE